MAKISILATTFALLFVLTTASIYRTTITTTEILDNPSESQCRQEAQRQKLNNCSMFLKQCSQMGMILRANQKRDCSRQLDMCCSEMEQMSEGCRCMGVQMAMEQMQGQMREMEREQVMQTARSLPGQCELPPRMCDFGRVWF
ncbi:Bifunctional inhibitor/plant lipid transfer protein/seed storage helical domain [Dillenia turbinata]|uniref:Bifunctional inhibitor/plant lipid transfer protein/seed storage helical domain n=1 Tax=Dillenia turbinata TaxID=194707 RepID=A0AAN8V989_9MAGN